jgi:hypothetical protein
VKLHAQLQRSLVLQVVQLTPVGYFVQLVKAVVLDVFSTKHWLLWVETYRPTLKT